MKKFILSMLTVLAFVGGSYAQIQTVEKPKAEVKPMSTEWRWTTTGVNVKFLADGKNDNRAAINVGEGFPLSRVVPNLPVGLGGFRIVPLVTLNAGQSGAAPRTTLALLAPKYQVVRGFTLQPGVAAKGLQMDNNFNAVNGLQAYVSASVDFEQLSKTLGLKRVLGL